MAATNAVRTFAAIAYNEVLFNSKRVAPYALIILFAGAAVLGWGRGPAAELGWATNSDFYIARGLKAFSFLFGVPIFNAMLMGDAVSRDFRLGIDALTFSKPISRAQYLFGKFFGNFLVLVGCMAAFPLTQLALQVFHPAQMVVQPFKVLPYFQHFFFFVVIAQFAFAALFFMVGALTRNSKIVYFLAISFYPVFIASMFFLLTGWSRGKILLDPFLLNSGPSKNGFGNSADYLNQYVYSYTPDMIWNRVGLILVAVVCLIWLYVRFTITDRAKQTLAGVSLALSTAIDNATYESDHPAATHRAIHQKAGLKSPTKLKNLFSSAFFAIFQNEVLLNSKRVAPYVVALLSAANAVLWWGWGPATGRNMATNSDAFIAGVLPFYCFLFQPLLAMIIMADPTIRDFRVDINPLIFSKPVSRAEYLLGKFFGNFFTLSCCQFMFVATLFVLQWVPKHGMVVQEAKFLAYPKHFLAYVVISYLPLAAFYFTVGTLTRNVKIVYGAGLAVYPVFISYAIVFLKRLPWRWGALLDPLLINWGNRNEIHATSAEVFNQLVIVYDSIFIANRIGMILLTAICLTILYLRFTTAERSEKAAKSTFISLSSAAEGVYYSDSSSHQFEPTVTKSVPTATAGESKRGLSQGLIVDPSAYADGTDLISREVPALPEVVRLNEGIRANVNKLVAAIGIEFRLLRAERSLVVVMPLALFLSLLEVAFYPIHSDSSLSSAYASNTATSVLIFVIGIAVFYTGEAMHRDREIRIEPFLWTTPVSNSVLILSKFLSTLLLLFALIASVGIAAVIIQVIRQHTPIDLFAYFKVYGLIVLPSAFILAAVSVAATVVTRNKYAFYAVSIGTAAALFYLYSNGYNDWLYNPVMYRLWTYASLTGSMRTIVIYRLTWLAISIICLVLAHLFFERRSRRKVYLPLPFALR